MEEMPPFLRDQGVSYAGLRMTAHEYLAIGETQERYELIDGVVHRPPRPTPRHQKMLCLLLFQVELFLDAHPGFDCYPSVDIKFNATYVYAPDLCCLQPGRAPPLDATIDVAPDLIMEILLPASRKHDLIRKRADYGHFGVREYWVVDPADGSIRCFRQRGGQMVEAPVVGDSLRSEAIEGLCWTWGRCGCWLARSEPYFLREYGFTYVPSFR